MTIFQRQLNIMLFYFKSMFHIFSEYKSKQSKYVADYLHNSGWLCLHLLHMDAQTIFLFSIKRNCRRSRLLPPWKQYILETFDRKTGFRSKDRWHLQKLPKWKSKEIFVKIICLFLFEIFCSTDILNSHLTK